MEETIIIGGGIAGLACAKRLSEEGAPFTLISPEIGGRVSTSSQGDINYAAYVVPRYYKHFKQYVTITRPIRIIRDCMFHGRKKNYSMNVIDFLRNPVTYLKIVLMFFRFRREYRLFMKDCEVMSQKKAIEKRPIMKELLEMNSKQFLKKNKLEDIHAKYFAQYGNSIGFKNPHKAKLLGGFVGADLLFSSPKEFIFEKEKLIGSFKERIVKDKIVKIVKKKSGYTLKSSKKTYTCKNLVVATPPWVANKLLKLGLTLHTISVDMVRVEGTIREGFEKRFNLFSPQDVVSVIAKQSDGSYLVYYEGKLKLNEYFSKWKVIERKKFRPAFTSAHEFVETKLSDSLFLAGDYNISSVEDSLLTGLYAANTILGKDI